MTTMYDYTANQPLCLGGQIYMYNRHLSVRFLIHMTTAQLTKKGHQSKIELSDRYGKKQWFIIPLKDRTYKPINSVEPVDPAKMEKSLRGTLQALYGKSPFYEEIMVEVVEQSLNTYFEGGDYSLSTLNVLFTESVLNVLDFAGAGVPFTVIDKDVLPQRPEHPSEWIAQLGQAVKAKTYLGGGTAQKAYLREEDFASKGMGFHPQDFTLPPYLRDAKHGTVVSDAMVCILEPLFCVGPAETARLLQG